MSGYVLFLYRLSRPRFWLYLAGTYAVGYAAGISNLHDFWKPQFFGYLLFFLIPANIFLYGVNDLYDSDTDQFNEKKGTKEQLLHASEIVRLRAALIVVAALGAALLLTANSVLIFCLLTFFYFLSFFYSAPPLRFKARPFIDFISNLLYGLPGFIGFAQATGSLPSWPIIVAVCGWTWAMHLFSAVPDIASDAKAGLSTSAVVFGQKRSLVVCSLLWLVSCLVVWVHLGPSVFSCMAIVYPLIPIYLLFYPHRLKKAYWYFPLFNTVTGFTLFMGVLFLF